MNRQRIGICDIEADGLVPSRIHCIGFLDLGTGERFGWKPHELHSFERFDEEVRCYIGHNFLTYDAPVLNRLLGLDIKVDRIMDTLILSRLLCTTRPRHSLESWGNDLGVQKIEFNDFEEYSDEMYTYMMGDIDVNKAVWEHLDRLRQPFSGYCQVLEHKVQDFLNVQKQNGFFLDVDKVYHLHDEIKGKRNETLQTIKQDFPPMRKLDEVYTPRYNKLGTLTVPSQRKLDRVLDKTQNPDGTWNLYSSVEFNINSPSQIVERMNEAGWDPVDFTEKGNPRVTEENLSTLPDTAPPAAKLIVRCKLLENRLSVLDGWLDAYNPQTGCIHGDTIGLGAVTHRMAHRNPQMANIPAVRNEYGKEFRSCLGIKDKTKDIMVGVDISGIQLRILAHYLDDPNYTQAVCFGNSEEGTDIHSVQMRILQEVAPSCTRDDAKTFIYAMLLGASGRKLGSILGVSEKLGYAAKDRLFQRIPAFKRVAMMCKNAAKRGYMIGIDGRRTPIKSEHFALSAYLQCGEAVIMKQALVSAREQLVDFPWYSMVVVHDEIQARTAIEHGEDLGKGLVRMIEQAGEFFELRVPVTGNYKLGTNWAETH